jgi:hypothetical protein
LAMPEQYSAPRRAATTALFPYAGQATQRALSIVFEQLELGMTEQAAHGRILPNF